MSASWSLWAMNSTLVDTQFTNSTYIVSIKDNLPVYPVAAALIPLIPQTAGASTLRLCVNGAPVVKPDEAHVVVDWHAIPAGTGHVIALDPLAWPADAPFAQVVALIRYPNDPRWAPPFSLLRKSVPTSLMTTSALIKTSPPAAIQVREAVAEYVNNYPPQVADAVPRP